MQLERRPIARLTAIALTLIGCDKQTKSPPPPPVETVPKPAAGCTLAPLPLRRPMPKRLVAIGDLHGDLGGTRSALRAAGAIDEADHWIGGELVVIQTGDVLDRGDDEQAIFDLIKRLEGEARAAGGALIMLIGNHELMNAAGDYRYVTPVGAHDFDEAGGSRTAALGPGGPYAKYIAEHDAIAIVGDAVFSHAGVLASWAGRVDQVNQASRCWLDGQAGGANAAPPALTSDDSPVWTRAYGLDPVDCAQAKAALDALGAKRMIVGHTVQPRGITSACDDTVWRIDVGLAKRYGGPIEVLEVTTGKVLRGTR